MTTLATQPPGTRTGRTRAGLTLLAMCLGSAMTFLQVTASISGLPTIQSELRVPSASDVWIPSAYTLLVAGLVLSAGTLGNRYGRKLMFCLGVVVLAAGSLVVMSASGVGTVVAGQAVAGVGGALILPNSVALLGAAYPDPHQRTEAITIWAASSGIGLAAGPLITGVLLDHFTWHATFLSAPVLAVLALALTVPVVAESTQPSAGRLDVAGLVLGTVAIGSLVLALIEGGHRGYTDPLILAAFAGFVLAAALFVRVEATLEHPMLDVGLFRSRSFSSVMVVAAVSLFGFTGVAVMQVLFFQKVQHLTALETGWRLLAMFGPYVLLGAVSGRLIRRVGFRLPLAGGLLAGSVASLLLTSQDATTGFGAVWWIFVMSGVASGLVIAPSTAAAMVSVQPAQAGMASGAVNTARQVGTVLGTSILGTLLTSHIASHLPGALAANGVPTAARGAVLSAVAAGSSGGTLPGGAREAIGSVFADGVHLGVTVVAVVYLLTAALVLGFVHNRPHDQGPARA